MKHTHETITETGIKRAVEQMIEATASRCNIIDFANSAHFQLNRKLAAQAPCFSYGVSGALAGLVEEIPII